ncbi:MAG: fibronectin type III domain-containing protein [Abitibacteriaceae bacterium]|nr:fibronectin type III domain-containing protein [Abditibacteriaceae bacterium]MBV9868046.1 fibronectin type III domain-containing protein [Abditibacteriaceae bacterium]
MAQDYIPATDAAFLTFGTTLAQNLTATPAVYGVTAAQATTPTNAMNQVGQALQDVDALKAQLASAVMQKEQLLTAAEQLIRPLVRQIQANPNITDAQKAQAGLPIHDTQPSATTPMAPTNLVVKANADGVHELAWNRNGNLPGTLFIVECKRGTDTAWFIVNIVAATRLKHGGNTPGQKIVYQVRARRGNMESANSNEAGAYLS